MVVVLGAMNTHSSGGPGTLRRLSRGRLATILTRYAVGSVVAAIVTEVTVLALIGFQLTGPKAAAVCAWVAGSATNYILARNWAWERRGRRHSWRELVPFWAMSVVNLAASTYTTDLAHAYAPSVTASPSLQLAIIGAIFLGTYGVLFIAKFFLLHFVIFADRKPAPAPR